MTDEREDGLKTIRGQIGIGTLIVFISMVIVAAIAAGVLIDTSDFLASKGDNAGQESGEQVSNRVQVMETTALRTTQDERTSEKTLGGVELIVTKVPGADDFHLTDISIQWVDASGTYSLVHENHFEYDADGNTALDGAFAHEAIKDRDGSLAAPNAGEPAINNQDDRASLIIDVGQNDVFEDNRIGNAYDNHTYNHQDDFTGVDEATVRSNLADPSAYTRENVPDHPYEKIEQDGTTDYALGTVIRSDFRYEQGFGLAEGKSAELRLTTATGTTTTVRIYVPGSLYGKTAVRV